MSVSPQERLSNLLLEKKRLEGKENLAKKATNAGFFLTPILTMISHSREVLVGGYLTTIAIGLKGASFTFRRNEVDQQIKDEVARRSETIGQPQ